MPVLITVLTRVFTVLSHSACVLAVRTRHPGLLITAILGLFLVSCGGGGNGGSVGSGEAAACRYVLENDVTSPSQLVNTEAACDYELKGRVEVRSLLDIEPGTVVRAGADAVLVFDGGELRAVGREDARIVLEGNVHASGYWQGIDVERAESMAFHNVDIRDAGQNCVLLFCADVGVYIDDTTLTFVNSTVSNSDVHGMSIAAGVDVIEFSNNRFFGNAINGLNVDSRQVGQLDTGSDYVGAGDPNASPGVGIIAGEHVMAGDFVWKRLNAPYQIGTYFDVSEGNLIIEAGVELVFGEEAWLTIENNGSLEVRGTAVAPVRFRGLVEAPGYWDGIRFEESAWSNNRFEHAILSHSGNTEGLVSAFGALSLNESRVALSNTILSDNAQWGINCINSYGPSQIVDGGGNQFVNNGLGGIDPECLE